MRMSQNLDLLFFCWNRSKFSLAPFLSFFPAFLSSFLSTLHILLSGRKSLDKIIGKPWKGDVDQLQVCWPVYAPILHQKRSVFFFWSAPSDCSQYTKCMVLCCAVSVAYLKSWLTCKLMTSQVVQWPLLQMSTKVDFSTERVKRTWVQNSYGILDKL